jgi:hypothetical protein
MSCKTNNCERDVEAYRPNRFLSMNLFGLKAAQIVDDYCLPCQQKNLKDAWWGFLALVVVAVALSITALALVHCGGSDEQDFSDVLQDIAALDVVDPIDESLSSEAYVGEDSITHLFDANVLKVCRFDKAGQLYIGGSDVSSEGTRTFNLKMGVSEGLEIPEEGIELPVTGVASGEDVLAGEAQLYYEFSANGLPQASVSVLDGTVVLRESSPCEGSFSATMSLADDTLLALQNGAFLLELQ